MQKNKKNNNNHRCNRAVDMHWKMERPCFSDVGGPTLVKFDASENFEDFDPLDWLKLHSLNNDFRDLSVNEI